MYSFHTLRRLALIILLIIGCQGVMSPVRIADEPVNPNRNLARLAANTEPDCLVNAKEVRKLSGQIVEKYRPDTAPGLVFDARDAEFLNYQVRWGMIHIEGSYSDTGMCWVGGYVRSNKPWNASWDEHKDADGLTRNSTALNNASVGMTVSGLHFYNVHDGVRTNNSYDWVIKDIWGEYVRDDCIENDHLRSGKIYDSLFDGCYAGISTRGSSDQINAGIAQVIEIDRILLRMQPMPYPYKWETKSGYIDAEGNPYVGSGVPYGYGNLFKLTKGGPNPHFRIKNSTFLATHLTSASKLDFPPAKLIDECENNTIIWLGPGSYPGELPLEKFPNGIRIVSGQEGRDLWAQKVADWHARHPEVGAGRKPAIPGDLTFPKIF